MGGPSTSRATELLLRVRSGDGGGGAADELVPLVYDELRRIAGLVIGTHHGGTLNPTALVHEAYLRMIQTDRTEERDREHFFALAARAMRSALIDHARARGTQKRGGDRLHATLDEDALATDESTFDLLLVDDALTRLEAEHPRAGRIVELRFFGGLSTTEIAALLGCSKSTVEKDARLGRAFLERELT